MVKKIGLYSLYAIFSLLLVSCIFEIYLRYFSPQKIHWMPLVDKFGTFASYIKAGYKTKKEYAGIPYTIEIHENNLRNFKKIPYKKPKNTLRILSLGDSLFEGPGLEKNELFAYFLNLELEKNIEDVNFEVVNGAANGSFLLDYYLYLKNEGHKFLPDIVLLPWSKYDFDSEGLNFINFDSISFKEVKSDHIHVNMNGLKIEPPKSFTKLLMAKLNESYVYGLFCKKSQLLEKLRYRLNTFYKSSKQKESNVTDLQRKIFEKLNSPKDRIKKISVFFDNQQLGNLSRENPDIFPIIFNLIFKNIVEMTHKFGAQLVIMEMPDDEEALGVQTPRISTDFFSQLNAWRLNLIKKTAEFQKKNTFPLYIPSDSHWTPAGSYLTAVLTYNFLVENVLPKDKSQNARLIDLDDKRLIQKISLANERVLQYKDWSQNLLYLKANSLRNQNKFDQAILNYEKYLENAPDDYYAHFMLGSIHFLKKHFLKAKNHFLKGAQSSKNLRFKSLFKLGQTYDELKQYSKSIELFKNLINEFEENKFFGVYKIHNALGLVYRDTGDFEKAEASFKKAIEISPENSPYLKDLGNLYFDNQNFQKAVKTYNTYIKLTPKNPKVLIITGLAYLQLNELNKAKKMFEKALQIQPKNKLAQTILSQLTKPIPQ